MDERVGVLLHEEAGRAALAEPLVATSVAVPLLLELGVARAGRSLAQAHRGGRGDRRGRASGERLPRGRARGARCCCSRTRTRSTRSRPATSRCERQPVNDPARRVFSRALDALGRDAGRRAARRRARCWRRALDRGALACAGAAARRRREQLLDLAVAYAKQRVQFGQPIGAFQAVKHHLANVKVALEYARPVVYRAAHSVARARRRARGPRLARQDRGRRGGGAGGARRRSRCTARSATPGSRTCTSGCGAPGRSSWPGAAAASTARASRSSRSRPAPRSARAPPSEEATEMAEAYIVDAVRTPVGKRGGGLAAGPPGRSRRARAARADGAHRRRSRPPSRT